MVDNRYHLSELTSRVIGAAMTVHNTLGNGFQEVIYQRALSIELATLNIAHVRELEMPIFYRGQQIGQRRVDLFVENCLSVELKAISELQDVHLAQAINPIKTQPITVLIKL